jgi:hypothetical protein
MLKGHTLFLASFSFISYSILLYIVVFMVIVPCDQLVQASPPKDRSPHWCFLVPVYMPNAQIEMDISGFLVRWIDGLVRQIFSSACFAGSVYFFVRCLRNETVLKDSEKTYFVYHLQSGILWDTLDVSEFQREDREKYNTTRTWSVARMKVDHKKWNNNLQ